MSRQHNMPFHPLPLRELASAPRNLQPGEPGLSADEQALLDRICEAYYLPAWCSINDYRRIFEAQGLQARIALGFKGNGRPQAACLLRQTRGGFAVSRCCSCWVAGAVTLSLRAMAVQPAVGWRSWCWPALHVLSAGPGVWLSSWSCMRAPSQGIKTADWSEEVAPFWGAVIRSALSAEGFSGLFKAGWTTIKACSSRETAPARLSLHVPSCLC